MKILIAPLNWGLGHATRCIPLIRKYLDNGDEVVLGGDGNSLLLLRRTFPELRVVDLPPLKLRYSENPSQRGFYLRAIPTLIRLTIADHYYLRKQLAIEHFDLIVSDNRFGLFSNQTRSVYITHQLYVRLPKRLRIFQPIARALHACIYKRYHEVWVPDYEDSSKSLAGELCHGGSFDSRVKYIGPLSRFASSERIPKGYRRDKKNFTLAILSGLEPQRSILEHQLLDRAAKTGESMLLIQGLVNRPSTRVQHGNVVVVPHLSDDELLSEMMTAAKIIARSGYSTIMDLSVLGLLEKAEFYPTPGQSEQEYLASRF
jgi:UDP:flavonoid glycosyltransferase YjiC (YdhE family)